MLGVHEGALPLVLLFGGNGIGAIVERDATPLAGSRAGGEVGVTVHVVDADNTVGFTGIAPFVSESGAEKTERLHHRFIIAEVHCMLFQQFHRLPPYRAVRAFRIHYVIKHSTSRRMKRRGTMEIMKLDVLKLWETITAGDLRGITAMRAERSRV